ncbi:hypothetical protein MPSEU_000170700 [Mayamaea pseudoterrestris]|nr:hypothetical protein MPSEU_000170700 [Mayamaea pseudoterrestris]
MNGIAKAPAAAAAAADDQGRASNGGDIEIISVPSDSDSETARPSVKVKLEVKLEKKSGGNDEIIEISSTEEDEDEAAAAAAAATKPAGFARKSNAEDESWMNKKPPARRSTGGSSSTTSTAGRCVDGGARLDMESQSPPMSIVKVPAIEPKHAIVPPNYKWMAEEVEVGVKITTDGDAPQTKIRLRKATIQSAPTFVEDDWYVVVRYTVVPDEYAECVVPCSNCKRMVTEEVLAATEASAPRNKVEARETASQAGASLVTPSDASGGSPTNTLDPLNEERRLNELEATALVTDGSGSRQHNRTSAKPAARPRQLFDNDETDKNSSTDDKPAGRILAVDSNDFDDEVSDDDVDDEDIESTRNTQAPFVAGELVFVKPGDHPIVQANADAKDDDSIEVLSTAKGKRRIETGASVAVQRNINPQSQANWCKKGSKKRKHAICDESSAVIMSDKKEIERSKRSQPPPSSNSVDSESIDDHDQLGDSWIPCEPDPPVPSFFKEYLAGLGGENKVGHNVTHALLSVFRYNYAPPLANIPLEALPPIIDKARPKFGLQAIAEDLIDMLQTPSATPVKKCWARDCEVTNRVKNPSDYQKTCFRCLMIGHEQITLKDEFLLRDWEVNVLPTDPVYIADACMSLASIPDFLFASADTDFNSMLDALAYASQTFGDVPVIVRTKSEAENDLIEMERGQRLCSMNLQQKVSFVHGAQPFTLWVNDDILRGRLLSRMREPLYDIETWGPHTLNTVPHHIAQLIVVYMNSACELSTIRPWPAALTTRIEKEFDEDNPKDFIEDRNAKVDDSDALSDASLSRESLGASSVASDILKNGNAYSACMARSQLWRQVDFWTDEVLEPWNDACKLGQPFNDDALAATSKAIRDKALYNPLNHVWTPCIGMKVRKMFDGEYFMGKVTGVRFLDANEDGKKVQAWQVTHEDGDQEEMEYHELLKFRQNRDRIVSPLLGQSFRALELCCGRGVITDYFHQRLFKVMSVDIDPYSNATHKMDLCSLTIHDIRESLGGIPHFVWASPDCVTNTRVSGGKHRKVGGHMEKTQLAHEHNFHVLKVLELLLAIRKYNQKAIFVIENPVGVMDHTPLMKLMKRSLGLLTVRVNYCAFGRDENKPTHLWTNNKGLALRLATYTCENICLRDHQHRHIRRAKGEKTEKGRSQLDYGVIPEPLACVVSRYVDAYLESKGRDL